MSEYLSVFGALIACIGAALSITGTFVLSSGLDPNKAQKTTGRLLCFRLDDSRLNAGEQSQFIETEKNLRKSVPVFELNVGSQAEYNYFPSEAPDESLSQTDIGKNIKVLCQQKKRSYSVISDRADVIEKYQRGKRNRALVFLFLGVAITFVGVIMCFSA